MLSEASQVAELQRERADAQQLRYEQSVNKEVWITLYLSTNSGRLFTRREWKMENGEWEGTNFDAKTLPFSIFHSPFSPFDLVLDLVAF